MRIYTKTGDSGETGLVGGTRVAKDHVRVEAYGDVDDGTQAQLVASGYFGSFGNTNLESPCKEECKTGSYIEFS